MISCCLQSALGTQYPDGAWLVKTHSFPVQRYFEKWGELGILGESDYGGWIAGGGGGVVVRLTPRVGLRTGAALNAHGGVRGPVTTYAGMEYRW